MSAVLIWTRRWLAAELVHGVCPAPHSRECALENSNRRNLISLTFSVERRARLECDCRGESTSLAGSCVRTAHSPNEQQMRYGPFDGLNKWMLSQVVPSRRLALIQSSFSDNCSGSARARRGAKVASRSVNALACKQCNHHDGQKQSPLLSSQLAYRPQVG